MNRAQQKSATRERILEVAVRRMRELGLDGAGVNAVMNAAGLTHGGFYAHFESRDDLAVQALAEAQLDNARSHEARMRRLHERGLLLPARHDQDGCAVGLGG